MWLHSVTLYHLHTIYISCRYRVTNFWILPVPTLHSAPPPLGDVVLAALPSHATLRGASAAAARSRSATSRKNAEKKTPGEIENNVEIYGITE